MECKKCKKHYNSTRWAELLINLKYWAGGGKAADLKTKHQMARAMRNRTYLNCKKTDTIQVREYNHCFNCGYSNKEKIKNY